MSDEAIQKFVDATGGSVEQAIKYLSICDNNVSLAVECYVDQQPINNNGHNSHSSMDVVDDDGVRAPIPSRTERIVEETVRVGRLSKRPANVFDGERNFSAEFNNGNGNHLARRKLKGLAELFKPPTDISFVGTLEGAKLRGKKLKRWLLVNVQDVTDFQCQVLNRDLWCRQEVRSVLESHFVFWQIYRDSIEGEHFLRFYNAHASPFIGIIDPSTGELMKQWNFLTKNELISEITLFLSDNYHVLHSPLSPPSKRPCTNKARGILTDITDTEAAPSSSRTSDTPSSSSSTLTPEPEPSHSGITIVNGVIINNTQPNPDDILEAATRPPLPRLDPHMLHITFRLPDGARRTQTFTKSCTCAELYTWLYTNGFDRHVVLTHFPKSVITSNNRLIAEVVSSNRAMLHIEEIDD